MNRIPIFFIIPLLWSFVVHAQEIQKDDLQLLSGSWTGTLTYTNYGDDSTRYSLQTKMIAEWQGKKVMLAFEYTEPNGEIVKGKQSLKLGKTPNEIFYNGKWPVTGFLRTENGWELSVEKPGKDNNRNAMIRQKLILAGGNALTITKLVKYEGTEHYFQRNQYAFKK